LEALLAKLEPLPGQLVQEAARNRKASKIPHQKERQADLITITVLINLRTQQEDQCFICKREQRLSKK
jgi:hypothetical protein